jgi:hypothetical protein
MSPNDTLRRVPTPREHLAATLESQPVRYIQHQAATEQAISRATSEFDPKLFKPVAIAPPPPMSEAERARLHSELLCLKRERDTTQEAIDFILEKLAA